jgi:hypothetical protein
METRDMKHWNKRMGSLAAVGLVAAALAASGSGSANAQVAFAVEFHNDHGASAGCSLPPAPPVSQPGATNTKTNATCSVSGTASGHATGPLGEKNFCLEGASANTNPRLTAGLYDCSVSVSAGELTGVTTATRNTNLTVTYTCNAVGTGTATYQPSPGSTARRISGVVVVKYADSVFTADGAMYTLGDGASAGNIHAVGVDGCAPNTTRAAAPESFSGTIN